MTRAAAPGRTAHPTGGRAPRHPFRPAPLVLFLALLAGARPVPAAPEDAHAVAARLEAEGRTLAAADRYRTLCREDPMDREAALGLSRTSVVLGSEAHLAEALAVLSAQVDAHGDDVALRVALGEVLMARAALASSEALSVATSRRAIAHFAAAAEAAPDEPRAALGLARARHACGDSEDAVAEIDAYLKRPNLPRDVASETLATKGRILYEHGVRLHREAGGTYPLSEETRRAFERARGSLRSAVAARPDDFDAWLRLAWSAQMLGDRDDAQEGYGQAAGLRPDDPLPLRGLLALYADDPDGRDRALRALARERPAVRRVLVVQGLDRIRRGLLDEAERLLEPYLTEHPDDAEALYALGKAKEARGVEDAAVELFLKALRADGTHLLAAEALDARIRKTALAKAKQDLAGCEAVRRAYEDLIELAPANPYLQNNVAFALREAWIHNRYDPAWREVLDQAVAHYEEAARIIGPWSPQRHAAIPRERRWHFAQIVCDDGVILNNYEPVRDLVRAESRFLEALRWSDDGYLDAWTYLSQIYDEQRRWEELYRLAVACAAGLANEAGEPDAANRAKAKALAARLVEEGKIR